MTTSHDATPQDLVIVDDYQFDFVTPGTYLRPQVLVRHSPIDIDNLHDGYLEACERVGVQPDWEIEYVVDETTQIGIKKLNPGFWNIGILCNEGWDVDFDLTDHLKPKQAVELFDDPVEFVVISYNTFHKERFIKTDTKDPSPVVACVVKIYEPISLKKLGETLELLGAQAAFTSGCLNVNADILMTADGEIQFDLEDDPDGGSLSLEADNVMQQHASREAVDRFAQQLVHQHLNNENPMTSHEQSSQDNPSAQDIAETNREMALSNHTADDALSGLSQSLTEFDTQVTDTASSQEEQQAPIQALAVTPASAFVPVPPIEPSISSLSLTSAAPLTSDLSIQPLVNTTVAPIQPVTGEVPQAKINKPSHKKNHAKPDPKQFGDKKVDISKLLENGIAGRVPYQRPERRSAAPVPSLNVPKNTRIPTLPRSQYAQKALKEFAKSAIIDPAKDGIDHINIGTGSTELGKWLGFNFRAPFSIEPLGDFASLGALWVYLRCIKEERTEHMRTLSGTAAREKSKTVRVEELNGLYEIMADAAWLKVNTYDERVQQMVDNRLPYLMYIVHDDGTIETSPFSKWYVPAIQAIGEALKQSVYERNPNIAPDFRFLKSLEDRERHYRELNRQQKERRYEQGRQDRREGAPNGYQGQPTPPVNKSQDRPYKGPQAHRGDQQRNDRPRQQPQLTKPQVNSSPASRDDAHNDTSNTSNSQQAA